jgi:hypothetical protein
MCLLPARRGHSAPGEPPDGTSPAMMPRRHHGGGAGPAPRNHRHDRCSRWEELTGSMDEGKRAWRKTREEKCQKRGGQRFLGADGHQSIHVSAVGPSLRHSRPRERLKGAESVGNCGRTPPCPRRSRSEPPARRAIAQEWIPDTLRSFQSLTRSGMTACYWPFRQSPGMGSRHVSVPLRNGSWTGRPYCDQAAFRDDAQGVVRRPRSSELRAARKPK